MALPTEFWLHDGIAANLLIVAHLIGALLAGFALGYERSHKGHAAGMRTYAIVCMGSAALTIAFRLQAALDGQTADALSRAVQGLVTGIGFLGAGVIMREGFRLRGLSTAASIWAAASIGILIGLGFYLGAIAGVLLVVGTLEGIGRMERRLLPHYEQTKATLIFHDGEVPEFALLTTTTKRQGFEVIDWSFAMDREKGSATYEFVLQSDWRAMRQELIAAIERLPALRAFSVEPIRD